MESSTTSAQTVKRKLGYENESPSKEELLNIIADLEETVKRLKQTKSNQKDSIESPSRSLDFNKYLKRHIAIKIYYLGWDYDGFVVQDSTTNTIEYHLFNAFVKGRLIESRSNCNYHRCGRTDQGVSSYSQVISLTVRSRLGDTSRVQDELPYCKILNGLLPKDIRAMAWAPVPADFSARFSCKTRMYKYWFPRGDMNIEKMNDAIQSIVGTHDFRNLCKMDVANGVVDFHRRIRAASVIVCSKSHILSHEDFDMCEFTIVSDAFLWHQIRAIVSVLFLVGQNKEDTDIFEKLLDVEKYPRKPQYALSSPLPLNLYHCEYENVDWITEESNIRNVVSSLQSHWTENSIKTCMVENMLKECQKMDNISLPSTPYALLFKDANSKTYKPLLSRPTAESLENRITHYMKKGKLKLRSTTDAT